jgi:hypothetical protein
VWGTALDELNRAQPDARIINLETSVTRSEDYALKGINYRMSPENAECLAAAAIDCCALANNHILDWGQAGLIDTLATLEHLERFPKRLNRGFPCGRESDSSWLLGGGQHGWRSRIQRTYVGTW